MKSLSVTDRVVHVAANFLNGLEVINPLLQIPIIAEHDSSSGMLQEPLFCSNRLDHGTIRSQVSSQDSRASLSSQRILQCPNHLFVMNWRIFDRFPEAPATHRQAVQMQQISDLPHEALQPPRVKEILHQVFT